MEDNVNKQSPVREIADNEFQILFTMRPEDGDGDATKGLSANKYVH